VGIPGGGVNPLRGQNNVQGACDMGGLPDVFSGYQRVADPNARQRMAGAWNVPELPDTPGLKVTQMFPAAHEGKLKAMYIIGENPLVSDADLNHAEKSLSHLEFLVVQDIFLNETARRADVVLPSACYAEKEGTFSNTERRVQRVRQAVQPPGEARDDWRIICDIAARMGYTGPVPTRSIPARRFCIASSSPSARVFSTPSILSRRPRPPTTTTRCISPRAGCSTTIIPAP
jgi:predicted molibdopterin-dependent oxidoreductase YjgC